MTADKPPLTLLARSLADTATVARAVAGRCAAGDVILLAGDLAAGKTQFVQFLGEALCIRDPIVSPTFTLANIYAGDGLPLLHVDAYRLKSEAEFADLSLDEVMETHVTAIEWGDMAAARLPIHLRIMLSANAAGERRIALTANGLDWTDRFREIARDLSALIETC